MNAYQRVQLELQAEAIQRDIDGVQPLYQMLAGNRAARRAPGGPERRQRAVEWRRGRLQSIKQRQDALAARIAEVAND